MPATSGHKKNEPALQSKFICFVRLIGLEPTRLTTPDPKSGAATNYATAAKANAKIDYFSQKKHQSLN